MKKYDWCLSPIKGDLRKRVEEWAKFKDTEIIWYADFDECFEKAEKNNIIIVENLAALGDPKELIFITDILSKRSIDLLILESGLDTSTAAGMMCLKMYGVTAEYFTSQMIKQCPHCKKDIF